MPVALTRQAEIALDGAVGKLLFVAHNKSALFDVHVDELRQSGMDVGRSAADIHEDHAADALLLVAALGKQLARKEHGARRRDDGLIRERITEFLQALRMGDLVDELLVDGDARGLHVQLVDRRQDVRHADAVNARGAEFLRRLALGELVAAENDRAFAVHLADDVRVFEHVGHVAAVRTAGEQDDVGLDLAQHFLAELGRLVRGDDLHDTRTGGHGNFLRGLRGHAGHVPHGDHAQSARGAARAEPDHIGREFHALGADLRLGAARAVADVLQRRRVLAAGKERQFPVRKGKGRALRIGAADIINKNVCFHRFDSLTAIRETRMADMGALTSCGGPCSSRAGRSPP